MYKQKTKENKVKRNGTKEVQVFLACNDKWHKITIRFSSMFIK